jgi:hypothetical protein
MRLCIALFSLVAAPLVAPAAAEDARTPIKMPPDMRSAFLEHMRHHMDSLDDVMTQLAAADFRGAAKVAREQLVPGSGAGFGRYLPVEFREMGLARISHPMPGEGGFEGVLGVVGRFWNGAAGRSEAPSRHGSMAKPVATWASRRGRTSSARCHGRRPTRRSCGWSAQPGMRESEVGLMRTGRGDGDLDAPDRDRHTGAEFEELRADGSAGGLREFGARQS